MTLTIELTPEQEAALQTQASAAGMDAAQYTLQRLGLESPSLSSPNGQARSPRALRVQRGYGMLAHSTLRASEADFEGRQERERENRELDRR